MSIFIETPVVEGGSFATGQVGWKRTDEEEDGLFQSLVNLVFGKVAIQGHPRDDKFLGMLAGGQGRENDDALKSLRFS